MAITWNPTTPIAGMSKLYINEYAVGPNVNDQYNRSDVLLIQYLLYSLWYGACLSEGSPVTAVSPPSMPPITIDGVFGPETENWILYFQQNDPNNCLLADGRIDYPASLDQGGISGANSHRYTIIELNATFYNHAPNTFNDLTTDVLPCPQELLNALQTGRMPTSVISSGGS